LNGEVLNLAAATASIERALMNGADLIEMNIASIAGGLYASPADTASADARPLLSELLAKEKLASSDALVALEIVEGTSDAALPDDFAKALFNVIDKTPSVARNGRPLWVRATYSNRAYLQALAAEAKRRTVAGPYVRFVVADPGGDAAVFYSQQLTGASLDFADAVSVDYRHPNALYRLERLRSAGKAAILEEVPGPGHGEMVLAALRERADAIITNYRADQARRIVTRQDVGIFFSGNDISTDGRFLTVHGVQNAKAITWQQELDKLTSLSNGTPVLVTAGSVLDAIEGGFWGSYLSFKPKIQNAVSVPRWLELGDAAAPAAPHSAFLASFYGTLEPPPDGNPQAFLFVIGGDRDTHLDFPVYATTGSDGRLTGAFVTDNTSYTLQASASSSCVSKNGLALAEIASSIPHWIVLTIVGDRLTMFVDGRCAGVLGLGTITPQDFAGRAALGFGYQANIRYTGAVQQMQVLRWEAVPPTDGEN